MWNFIKCIIFVDRVGMAMKKLWNKFINWLIGDEDIVNDYMRNYSKYSRYKI